MSIITFTLESRDQKGSYLTHQNLPLKCATTGRLMTDVTYNVIEDYSVVDTIIALLYDNTFANTGGENGLVTCLEEKLMGQLRCWRKYLCLMMLWG